MAKALKEPVKKAARISDVRREQMSLFMEVIDSSFSNAIEFYDMLPRHVHTKKTVFREDELPAEEHIKHREFITPVKMGDTVVRKRCYVKLSPALIIRHKGGQLQRYYAYPSYRELLVEDAIRKIAIDQGGFVTEGQVGCRFTVNRVRSILKETGHECKYEDIVESINILNKCHMEYGFIDDDSGKPAVQGRSSMFTEVYLRTAEDKKIGDIDSVVKFHPLVTASIQEGSYRNYDFVTSMKYRLPLSNYLHRRLTLRFKQASTTEVYGFYITNLFNDWIGPTTQTLKKQVEQLKEALQELSEANVLDSWDFEYIKDEQDKRKSKDAHFKLKVTQAFASNIIKINSHSKSIANRKGAE